MVSEHKYGNFVEEHIVTLEHFIEGAGHPLKIFNDPRYVNEAQAKALCNGSRAFTVKENKLCYDSNKLENALFAAFYQKKLIEVGDEFRRLQTIVIKRLAAVDDKNVFIGEIK